MSDSVSPQSGDLTHLDIDDAHPGCGRPSLLTLLGWAAVVAMAVIIAVLTAVLAGMLLVVSVWLTVAVPVVVLAAVVAAAAYARRS